MITIAIPTYNSMKTLTECLCSLDMEHKLILVDNESFDGTEKFGYRVASVVRYPGFLKKHNIARVRSVLAALCETKYIFYLDSDIILNESIAALLPHLSDEVGMVGYCIEGNTHHLQMGNALLHTSIARAIDWNKFPDQCNCLNAKSCLKDMGLATKQLPSNKVKHLRKNGHAI